MLKLSEFPHNHHPSEVRMLAKFIRRGFLELVTSAPADGPLRSPPLNRTLELYRAYHRYMH